MSVLQLDHINIRTAFLPESITFYGEVLGMTMKAPPLTDDMTLGAYAHDAEGRAIVHLVATDNVIAAPEPVRGAAQRGMIDHFALNCRDRELFVARLQQHGVKYSQMDVPAINRQLIFVRDPNGIMVELSFPHNTDQ